LFRGQTINGRTEDKTLTSRVLRTVNSHEGFWFYEDFGYFTGKSAANLNDFVKALKQVDIKSIDFHFGRGDFRRWIQFTIGDIDLAIRINRIPQDMRGEKLRSFLIAAVEERISQLRKKNKVKLRKTQL